jgi:dipeptidyl aminopeptidase/acylaminoacyl peptidase
MQRDIRQTSLYREAEAIYEALRRPGTAQISDAAEVSASPNGRSAVFSGTIVDKLEGALPTRICMTELKSGAMRVMTFGPNADRSPKFSPDGRRIAFLSDRAKAGDFQLYLLDPISGAALATPPVQGWVEYLDWSPDGERILLGVAGHGADIAGGQGAVTSKRGTDRSIPLWAPQVETGDEGFRWRRVWVYALSTNTIRPIPTTSLNIWEAAWCGNASIATVASTGPSEGLWYDAALYLIDIQTGVSRELYQAKDQLGWPAGSPSGKHVVVVHAVCSDRWIVAGDLLLVDTRSGRTVNVDTRGVDISCTQWRSDSILLLAGHRGFETVIGVYDLSREIFAERWTSQDVTTGGRYASVSGFDELGDCMLVGESFVTAPELAVIRNGVYEPVRSFDLGYAKFSDAIAAVQRVTWKAPDALNVQGWLLTPKGKGPYPLVMAIHGGPVWHWRPFWLGRASAAFLMLMRRGCAVFFPNPRGSGGRGQEFARCVVGEMGGADAFDCLSGLDHLVELQIADPERLGVTGVSYGGFMTAWLIGQDRRFAAAVAIAPVINHVTEHLISNIPHFVAMFLQDTYTNPTGKYFTRSPLMHAHKARTPTLNICGALDRCTPPEEAVQFHNALVESGARSVLVTYPEEGHGIRKFPAVVDVAARTIDWFEEHLTGRGTY